MSASSLSSKNIFNAILSNSRPRVALSSPSWVCHSCQYHNLNAAASTSATSLSSSSKSSSSRQRRRSRNLESDSPNATRKLSTTNTKLSSWPVGASSASSEDFESHHHSATPSPSIPRQANTSTSRARAGPALQDTPPLSTSKLDGRSKGNEGSQSSSDSGHGRSSTLPSPPSQKTIMYLNKMKQQGTPIAMMTSFDYPTSLSIRSADIDICLIGDSLANVCLGYSTTQSLSLDAMIHHCQSVQRGLSSPLFSISQDPSRDYSKPLVIADLPFGTFMTLEEGIKSSVKLIQQGGIDGLKIEGGSEVLPLINKLTDFGIPVMAHLGLQPQKVASTSGYRVQAKTSKSALQLLKDCKAAQDAGAFAILLECIPTKVADLITKELQIPTIGIGAGRFTDGQVLVISDMLGELTSPAHVLAGLQEAETEGSKQQLADSTTQALSTSTSISTSAAAAPLPPKPSKDSPLPPKFVRSFVKNSGTSLGALRIQAVRDYVDAVRDRSFPNDSESYKIEKKEWEGLMESLEKEKGGKQIDGMLRASK